MSVNNKALEMSTDGIANVIRNELGKENVIMLLNGERLVECLGDLHNTYELEVILNLINIEDEDLFVTRIDSLRYLNLSLLSKSKREQFLSQVKPLSEKSSAPIKKY